MYRAKAREYFGGDWISGWSWIEGPHFLTLLSKDWRFVFEVSSPGILSFPEKGIVWCPRPSPKDGLSGGVHL